MLDVYVFVTGLAVGEMVGAWVSPELVGDGVGACVVTAQAGAQPEQLPQATAEVDIPSKARFT